MYENTESKVDRQDKAAEPAGAQGKARETGGGQVGLRDEKAHWKLRALANNRRHSDSEIFISHAHKQYALERIARPGVWHRHSRFQTACKRLNIASTRCHTEPEGLIRRSLCYRASHEIVRQLEALPEVTEPYPDIAGVQRQGSRQDPKVDTPV